ncbi:MAG: methyltransferase, TIGR04325 family [Patescibacteria group bacterium]|nr:methyltransferase, TIGR04325 family [Patescibacteria group bacterium]
MKDKIKQIIKAAMPPALLALVKDQSGKCKYEGVYHDWVEARKKTSGYDDRRIMEKALAAAMKAENGEAVWERDTVLFDQIEYSWPLLAALMLAAAKARGRLNVLDFGGSFGTTYRQNKKFLDRLESVKWNIVEQDQVVEEGKKNIKNENIRFWPSVARCLTQEKIDLVVFSASIQYLADPYGLLKEIMQRRIDMIVLDRLITSGQDDFITIQKVPPNIYSASYPVWILNPVKLKNFFQAAGYELLEEFPDPVSGVIKAGKQTAEHRGYIFTLPKK